MIFRKTNPLPQKKDTPLQRINNLVASIPALKICILDTSVDSGTLVILCTDTRMNTFAKLTLENHWFGVVEVFNTAELVIGGRQTTADVTMSAQQTGSSRHYLN